MIDRLSSTGAAGGTYNRSRIMVSNVFCMRSRVVHIIQADHRGDGKDQHPPPVTFLPSLRVSHTARGENKNQEALLRWFSLH